METTINKNENENDNNTDSNIIRNNNEHVNEHVNVIRSHPRRNALPLHTRSKLQATSHIAPPSTST